MSEQNNTFDTDIEELNTAIRESIIHYNPKRVDYTIDESELAQLALAGNSIWKDVFLTSLGIGVPTVLNGLNELSKLADKAPLTTPIFVNFLVAGITLVLAVISFFVWQHYKKSFSNIIQSIKNKPKFRMPTPP